MSPPPTPQLGHGSLYLFLILTIRHFQSTPLSLGFSCTALTALGISQEVEQISANAFYSTI